MMKKSKMKTLAIALCATVMSGLYATDVGAEQFTNLQVNGENTYFDVNNNNINVSISGGPSIAIKKNTNEINVNAGKSLTTVTKSDNGSSTSIKQKENWSDKKQQIEMEARDPGKADSRLVVSNKRIDLDVNDRLRQEGANRVVEAESMYNPNGMKIWDQVRTAASITTRTQTKDMIGDYIGEMEPTINQHEFIGTGNWASKSMTKGYIGSNLVTTNLGTSERKAGYVEEDDGYIHIRDKVIWSGFKTEHDQNYGHIKDTVESQNYSSERNQSTSHIKDTVETQNYSSERDQSTSHIKDTVESKNYNTKRDQDYATIKETSMDKTNGNTTERKQNTTSINSKVEDAKAISSSTNWSDTIYDYVTDKENGYTSQMIQKAGAITSKVIKETVDPDTKEKTKEYTQVDQNKYGINVTDQNTPKDTIGSWISATDMSIVDPENTGKRISLSHVGQIANLDAEIVASLKASNTKVTVVNALNAEIAERRANDIVAGNISDKGAITLTKGDQTTINVGTVSDNSLSKVDFDKKTGNLTLTTTDKYGNDAQKDFTVEGLADRDYVDTAVENVNQTITNNNNTINQNIKNEIANREANDIVSGDISAKGEVTLTKGDGSTINVGTVSDNSLSKAEFDTKTGSLTLTTTDKYGNDPEKKLTVDGIASQDYVDNAIKEADKTIINNITNNINDVKEEINKNIDETKNEVIKNDIDHGSIGADGEVALYRNDGSKIDVGTVSDNRLSKVDFDAEKGELKFTVTDKYGNDPSEVFVEDIASKSALDKETQDRIEADTVINNRITKVDGKLSKVGAGAAALAALHPLDFDADDKLSFAAGVGNYDGENATAIGAFYRPTEKVMLSASGTVGNGENMVNMGVSFALDKPNNVSNTRVAMGQEILELRAQVAYQNAQLEAQGQKLSELMQLVGQLTGNRGLLLEAKALRAEVFPDVPENHWAYEYVEGLRQRGILEGYEDGYFRGDKMMTRYEFAAMLFRAMQKGEVLDDRIAAEFEPELGRIRVDRLKGIDTDTDKVERVRVVTGDNRDDYGYQVD